MKEFDIKKVNISDVVFTPDLLSFSYAEDFMNRQEEIADLKRRIEALENEGKQWEPEPGDWFVDASGEVELLASEYDSRVFGTERKTKQQAEKARDKMRVFNRLLAYHDEFCPDYEFKNGDRNYYVWIRTDGNYCQSSDGGWIDVSKIYFPEQIAKELCRKLNSGAVVL